MIVLKFVFIGVVIFLVFLSRAALSVTLGDSVFTTELWKFLVAISVLVIVFELLREIFLGFRKLFSFQPNPEKGVGYLQQAFSALLMKDHSQVLSALKSARKHLGDVPFISWMEGQACLLRGNTYGARARFFKLSERERNTTLGAYSLAQLALKDKSKEDAVEAIKVILQVYPDAQDFLQPMVSLNLHDGKIDQAFEYLKKVKQANKKEIEAVLYYEKWRKDADTDALKKAIKLSHLPVIACDYADMLFNTGERKTARKILAQSFEKIPYLETFEKFVFSEEDIRSEETTEKITSERIKRTEKLLKIAPQSWIPYYYAAKFHKDAGMLETAAQYAEKAYGIKQYDFIAAESAKINALIGRSVDLLPSHGAKFFWRCCECGHESDVWQSICSSCNRIASYVYAEEYDERLPIVKLKNNL